MIFKIFMTKTQIIILCRGIPTEDWYPLTKRVLWLIKLRKWSILCPHLEFTVCVKTLKLLHDQQQKQQTKCQLIWFNLSFFQIEMTTLPFCGGISINILTPIIMSYLLISLHYSLGNMMMLIWTGTYLKAMSTGYPFHDSEFLLFVLFS